MYVYVFIFQEWFGAANGEMLWNACRGIDETELQTLPVRKSVGELVTNEKIDYTRYFNPSKSE
jgi:nucleotidyltransferase/DNA polymerase involved in DNA repair